MEVVGLVSGDFVRTGGMDMPNFALAKRCAERGIETHLVAYRVAPELAQERGVTWHAVRKPFDSYLAASPFLDLAGQRLACRLSAQNSRVVVNGGNCQVHDVNWVHYVHAAYRPLDQTSRPLRRVKGIVARALSLSRERSALGSAQLVLVNSARTRQHLVEHLGVEAARIHVVYYGIDPQRFYPPSAEDRARSRAKLGFGERRQVAFVGALGDRRKGFDTLYAAWRGLCRQADWDCDMLVVGRGAELTLWQDRAKSEGLAQRVQFLGFRSDVPEILSACDALVAPTRYEAFGLGVQEALCTGLPALVSAEAGVAELYPEALQDLLVRDPESESELRAASSRPGRPDLGHLRPARCIRSRPQLGLAHLYGIESSPDRSHGRELPDGARMEELHVKSRDH